MPQAQGAGMEEPYHNYLRGHIRLGPSLTAASRGQFINPARDDESKKILDMANNTCTGPLDAYENYLGIRLGIGDNPS